MMMDHVVSIFSPRSVEIGRREETIAVKKKSMYNMTEMRKDISPERKKT
jgi:hypothetical protein